MSDVSQYCPACECESKPQCRCSHTCVPVVEPQQAACTCLACTPGKNCLDGSERCCEHGTCGEPQQPHVHEPAGPGEYCTGCFDQGAVWAEFEERARIIAIIEDVRDWYRDHGQGVPARAYLMATMDDLLAAIKEHR